MSRDHCFVCTKNCLMKRLLFFQLLESNNNRNNFNYSFDNITSVNFEEYRLEVL